MPQQVEDSGALNLFGPFSYQVQRTLRNLKALRTLRLSGELLPKWPQLRYDLFEELFYRRKDDRWCAQVCVGGQRQTGRRKVQSAE